MKTAGKSRISIAQKLAKILSLMIMLTLSVATITLSLREYADLQAKLHKKLELTADMIGQNSSVALLFDDKKTAKEVLYAVELDPEIVEGAIETPTHQILARYSRDDSHWHEFWPAGLTKTYQVNRDILYSNKQVVGRIHLTASLKQTYHLLLHNAMINAGIVWVALSLAGLYVLRLQHSFLKPILQLAETARQIEQEDDYSKRAIYEGNDEISDLAEAFNSMLSQIQRNEIYLEAQVQQRTQELEYAMQAAKNANMEKSQFFTKISHDINTPMHAISSLIELSLEIQMENRLRKYLEKMKIASGVLQAIIKDILDLSKMEAGKIQLEAKPFVLEDVLKQVYSTLWVLCEPKNLKLEFPEGLQLCVIGDSTRFIQIFLNLIGNAIKFTEEGQVKLTCIELNRSGDQVLLEFTISDTGIGMTSEQLSNLFQAFKQGDNQITRNWGGAGLGLVISKHLVELMGGNIRVSSQENIGSTFTFTVLLGVAAENSVELSQEKNLSLENSISSLESIKAARILVVEDNEMNRLVVQKMLEQVHLQVEIAENAQQALKMLKEKPYDGVLMDVQMPAMDGCQATRLLRQLPGCENLPVIAITASAMSNERTRCLEAGMNDFISKPIDSKTLFEALLKWIKPTVLD